MKFYCSIRLDIRRLQPIKNANGESIGARTKVKVVKNKLAAPFRVAEFDINWNEGISRIGSILDVALDMNIIEKRGSWFSYENEQLAQGRDAVKALLTEKPELADKIYQKIKDVLAAQKAAALGTPAAAESAPAPAEPAASGEQVNA